MENPELHGLAESYEARSAILGGDNMSHAQAESLHFERPPVAEVFFGLEFSPMDTWKIPHFGLYWNRVRADYPECDVAPPISSQPMLTLGSVPRVRCIYANQAKRKVVQIQDDRFLYNWRKVDSADSYPEFEAIQPVFESEWHRFKEFLSSEGLPMPVVNACDLTYINHLKKGSEWHSLADLPNVFEIVKKNRITEQAPAEAFNYSVTTPISAIDASITIEIQPALLMPSGEQIIQFALAVRGRPDKTSGHLSWFDRAHEAIRASFVGATTYAMHEHWGRKP